jgi:hypothetical protein
MCLGQLLARGTGGLEDLLSHVEDDNVCYALCMYSNKGHSQILSVDGLVADGLICLMGWFPEPQSLQSISWAIESMTLPDGDIY